ncbi:MAG: hypothetical protein WB816_02125 [Methylocystis sp.]
MRAKFFIILVAACAAFGCAPALAQAVDAPKIQPKKNPKTAKVKPAPAPVTAALPCPRAKWKDDPVCFGEGDSSALPLPSAGSTPGKEGAARSGDVTISPKMKINQDSPQPTYGNNPNGDLEEFGFWA